MLRMLCLLALPLTASAARHEVSFDHELHLPTYGPDGRVFTNGPISRFGIRLGYAVLRDQRRLGLVTQLGWRRGVQGGIDNSFRRTFATDVIGLGVKGDIDVGNIFYPYVAARAELVVGTAKLDGDTFADDNPTQFVQRGVGAGGQFALGFELMLPDQKLGWPVTAAIYVEGGYEVLSNMKLGELGTLDLRGGGSISSGIGLRF